MASVRTSIIGRPRRLSPHRRAHPATSRYTLICEEPDKAPLRGYSLDGARLLHELASTLSRRSSPRPVPSHVERPRMAALIAQHIARP